MRLEWVQRVLSTHAAMRGCQHGKGLKSWLKVTEGQLGFGRCTPTECTSAIKQQDWPASCGLSVKAGIKATAPDKTNSYLMVFHFMCVQKKFEWQNLKTSSYFLLDLFFVFILIRANVEYNLIHLWQLCWYVSLDVSITSKETMLLEIKTWLLVLPQSAASFFPATLLPLMQLHFMLPCYFPENHLNTTLAFSFLRQIFKSLFSNSLNVLWMLKPWCTSRHSLSAKLQPPSAVLVKQHWNNRLTQICEHQYLSKVAGRQKALVPVHLSEGSLTSAV